MCDTENKSTSWGNGLKTITVAEAVGSVLAHDITEIRQGEFKGRAFRKGHIVRDEDISHLKQLGKEHLFVMKMAEDEMHENDAAFALSNALMGDGVAIQDEPSEGKINLVAKHDGLLKVNRDKLLRFNMLGEVMCASLHDNTVVKEGRVLGGVRAIPLVVKRDVVEKAVEIASEDLFEGVFSVKQLRKPRVGVVITGNEVYEGTIKDAFKPIISRKVQEYGGEIIGTYYAPDDKSFITQRLEELLGAGADMLITTGGMSVDPDDVTRFAIRSLGTEDLLYGAAVLPGAMFLLGFIGEVPVLGIPACGMYHSITVLDLVMPRILAGERLTRRDIAEMGHGGLCLECDNCQYPVCPFGK
ncbi:MAG TPA: molybdopterin-binding protein [Nitrospirae bacterium]|nr:molybdopterin-binding protein [Nitrospirota bacterium]